MGTSRGPWCDGGMSALEWRPLAESDLDGIAELAEDCLAVDGGLPALRTPALIRELYWQGPGIVGCDETGEIVAAAALFQVGARGAATGLVHPAVRRQGHGESLVEWCREQSAGHELLVVAETMSPEAESLFARSGLRRTFAETVMRHDLHHIPRVARPDGLTVAAFDEQTEADFAAAISAALADQEGFGEHTAPQWLADERESPTFRPDDSRVVLDAEGMPVGFVLVSDGWIDLVGVAPAWRGRGLGAHLVARSLRALRKAGASEAWLCVSVVNPARALYERLGFHDAGTRARYEDRFPGASAAVVSAALADAPVTDAEGSDAGRSDAPVTDAEG